MNSKDICLDKRRAGISINETFIDIETLINVNDKHNLYRIDKKLKNKQKVYEGEVVGNISIGSFL
jgi:hypothetical protein